MAGRIMKRIRSLFSFLSIFFLLSTSDAAMQIKWFESKGACSKEDPSTTSEDIKTCAMKKAKEKVILLAMKDLGLEEEQAKQTINDNISTGLGKFIQRFEVSSQWHEQELEITLSAAVLLEDLRHIIEPFLSDGSESQKVTLYILSGIKDDNNLLSSELAKKLERNISVIPFFQKGIPSFQDSPAWFLKNKPSFVPAKNEIFGTIQLSFEQKKTSHQDVNAFHLQLQMVLYKEADSVSDIHVFEEQSVSNLKHGAPLLLLDSLDNQVKEFLQHHKKKKDSSSDTNYELVFRQAKTHTLLPIRDYMQNLNSYFTTVQKTSIAKLSFDGFSLLVSLKGNKASFLEELKKNFTPQHKIDIKENIITVTSLLE